MPFIKMPKQKCLPLDLHNLLTDCVLLFNKAADFIRYDVVEEELDAMVKRTVELLQKYDKEK